MMSSLVRFPRIASAFGQRAPVKLVNIGKCSRSLSLYCGSRQGPWLHRVTAVRFPYETPTRSLSISRSLYFLGKKASNENAPTNAPSEQVGATTDAPEKLGLFARFKKMYKEYWYVLVPVHCLTSVVWFGSFYYASTSGVDVIAILESLGVSETLINPVRDSSLGHIAIAYLLYKIATPARYTVTLGGTTLSIKYLEQWGYIKPMPSKAQLVQMYKDKKENIQEKIAEKKQDFQDRKQQLTDKKNTLLSDLKTKNETKPPPASPSGVTENK
ncbi:uncharacterized protein C18orf19 homolog A [Anopheles darlingi]|uniref:uncharacterized protein C18orf19 homolog A n=1 Tax=Anopheles darlingi TaxID=43151 RepID=UPI0021003490|nr:uncharacterized protein C18orf19 homolog A [Anopheles darlingi]